MPIETISRIIARIKHGAGRPISVFVITEEENDKEVRKLDAIYGDTIDAKRRQTALKPYHPSDKCPTCGHIQTHLAEEWIGDFTNRMNMNDVRKFLTKALEK